MGGGEKFWVWLLAWVSAIWLAYQDGHSLWSVVIPLIVLIGLGLWQKYGSR